MSNHASKHQHNQWVVIFDTNLCRIYNHHNDQLTLVKEIEHAENKLRDIDITTDKPGRYHVRGYAHGTYSQETDPKEIQIENFSRELSKLLDHARTTHAYEKLILVASPHVHGLLLKHLNKEVKNLISHNIEKDLVHLTERDLLIHLNEIIKNR